MIVIRRAPNTANGLSLVCKTATEQSRGEMRDGTLCGKGLADFCHRFSAALTGG